ncbi:MAG: hypothetical protein Q8935_17710 [Bacillota bacterium]|nr:hypothetical protein [Bacillota bacterium]MDP4154416.1 hypothetical protein [Bacillota bacterium]
MLSLRGDAHRLFIQLKRHSTNNQEFKYMKRLHEIEKIQEFYNSINSNTLKQVYYCMLKEKKGSGIIPILVSSIPWLLLLFSKQLQDYLFQEGSILWIVFVIVYIIIITISVILHFRENSWASVHIEIIKDILTDREKQYSSC